MKAMTGGSVMDRKTVSITQKRQFTIPIKYFNALGFDTEAECIMRGNELVIRPIKPTASGEFAEQILADLIAKGYQGEELLNAFKQEQAKVKGAIANMLAEAQAVAKGEGEYYTYDDIFNSEE